MCESHDLSITHIEYNNLEKLSQAIVGTPAIVWSTTQTGFFWIALGHIDTYFGLANQQKLVNMESRWGAPA